MDWKTIHAYAEEAELWTTLAINCWVLLAAALFSISYLRKTALPIAQRIIRAAGWSGYFLVFDILAIEEFAALRNSLSSRNWVAPLLYAVAIIVLIGYGIRIVRAQRNP